MQMFVSGVGGTGKSFLIQTLGAFVKATWQDLNNVTAVAARKCLAACNVSGVTTYQLFQLPIERRQHTGHYQRDLEISQGATQKCQGVYH